MRISDWSSDVCSSDLRRLRICRRSRGDPRACSCPGSQEDREWEFPRRGSNPICRAKARLRDRRVRQRSCRLRSEEHTSELQSLMRSSYAGFCLKKKNHTHTNIKTHNLIYSTCTMHKKI